MPKISIPNPVAPQLNWNGDLTGGFYNPLAWIPAVSPQPGDTLTISNGNPQLADADLQGYTIYLGGTSGSSGPGIIWTDGAPQNIGGMIWPGGIGDGTFGPNPTLTLQSSTIGANTTVIVPRGSLAGGLSGAEGPSATLLINGPTAAQGSSYPTSVNDGTIETASTPFSNGGTLNICSFDAIFDNQGVINASYGSTVALYGTFDNNNGPLGLIPAPGAQVINDGTFNIDGTMTDNSDLITGTGTINLDLLGLSERPGTFLYNGTADEIFPGLNGVGSGQDIEFHGGHLVLADTTGFDAILSNFGADPSDLIQLQDFTASSLSYAGGVLSVTGIGPFVGTSVQTVDLNFTNLPTGHFVFDTSGGTTNISWDRFPIIRGPGLLS